MINPAAIQSMPRKSAIILTFIAIAEATALAYLSLMAWLLSGWFLSDHIAFSLGPLDWWRIAFWRFMLWLLIAVAVATIVFVVNFQVGDKCWPGARKVRLTVAKYSAIVFVTVIAGASAAGALYFAITKPYL